MSEMVHITINKQPLEVPAGTRIIEAAKMLNIDIPHLCYHPDQTIKAHCRMCMVEVVGSRKLTAACSTVAWEGMEVITDSKKVYDAQTGVLDLILSDHKTNCLSCARNGSCELQALCRRFNRLHPELPDISSDEPLRIDNPSIVRDPAKCVKCGRCVKVCAEVQGCAALTYSGRSAGFKVTTAFDLPMDQTDCVLCGQCSLVCPVGAIVETDYTNEVTAAIQDPSKHVIVQVAPSVRVGLGDEFGMEAGAVVTGKMVTALRMLGFDKVFDTNFSADLTIMEEGSELLKRIREGGKLPMITSCSPGWVTYLEKHHPELIDHLSTAKSPQAMFGAVAKTYYAQKMGWDPHDVVSVSVMPCTAKKYEASRPELGRDGYQDVDYVLTTRELAKLIRYVGLDLSVLPESEFDSPLGTGSGAGSAAASSRASAPSRDSEGACRTLWGKRVTYSTRISWAERISLASPRAIRPLVPALMGASAGPGTANTSRFWSRASRAVISVPLCSAASTAATPADRPLRMRLRMGKRHPSGGVPGGFSDRMAPAAATSS